MTEDTDIEKATEAYKNEMGLRLHYTCAWASLAGIALGVLPTCAFWYVYSSDKMAFYAGASVACALWVIFIAMGRSETGRMRILTELQSMHTIVSSGSAGAKLAGGPQQEIALRPVNSEVLNLPGNETKLHFDRYLRSVK